MVFIPPRVTEAQSFDPSLRFRAMESGLRNAPTDPILAAAQGIDAGLQTAGRVNDLFDLDGSQARAEARQEATVQVQQDQNTRAQQDQEQQNIVFQQEQAQRQRQQEAQAAIAQRAQSGDIGGAWQEYLNAVATGNLSENQREEIGGSLSARSDLDDPAQAQAVQQYSKIKAQDRLDRINQAEQKAKDILTSPANDRVGQFFQSVASQGQGLDIQQTGLGSKNSSGSFEAQRIDANGRKVGKPIKLTNVTAQERNTIGRIMEANSASNERGVVDPLQKERQGLQNNAKREQSGLAGESAANKVGIGNKLNNLSKKDQELADQISGVQTSNSQSVSLNNDGSLNIKNISPQEQKLLGQEQVKNAELDKRISEIIVNGGTIPVGKGNTQMRLPSYEEVRTGKGGKSPARPNLSVLSYYKVIASRLK